MSVNTIFCENRPAKYIIHEGWKPTAATQKYMKTTESVEWVMQILREDGPFVAQGQIGPGAYKQPPFQLREPVGGAAIYGWPAGAERLDGARSTPLIVIGARSPVEDGSGHIYFTLAEDVTTDRETLMRVIQPSSLDRRVFIASHRTFARFEVDVFPSQAISRYVSALTTLPDGFLGQSEGKARCRQIGQEIFDSHSDGMRAMLDVHAAVAEASRHRRGFARSIESAWGGIGPWLS